ncbi:MAG: hypothetical protein KC776_39130 [Myxococcales bacterium]|nr:hypothetical protein [Myxococcales bacterium]MCB9577843.1 hypothetical protein [Polyangiaceae bacterium]
MQQAGFTQQPCSKCGTVVWIPQATGMGICPSCHTQNTLAGGAPQAAAPQQYPGMPNMGAASGGGFPVGRMIAGVGGAIVIGVLSIGGWYVKSYFFGGGGKGKIGYGQLGIDKSKADGDKMITSVSGLATKWKKDAVWWSVNYQAVRADGTVLLDKGAVVEYVSPSKVQSVSKKLREDSIKKFQFSTVGVDFSKKWNATNQWKNVVPPPPPTCTLKQVTASLASKGLTGDKTVRVTFDPQFQNVNVPTWHVIGDDPKIDAYYSMADCSEVPK